MDEAEVRAIFEKLSKEDNEKSGKPPPTKEEIDEVMKKMMPALDRDSNKEVTKEEWSTVCVLLTSKDNEKN